MPTGTPGAMAGPQPVSQQNRGPPLSTQSNNFHQAVSPPSKEQLKSWWKTLGRAKRERPEGQVPVNHGIFGVPLSQSISYANVAISLNDERGESFIYGYVPIVVAKCGVFLKEKATDVEGIFRLSGSAKRIKDLQNAFDTPERYGKGLDWAGYTVHDAANVLRRYLNQLPEPIVPLDFYERFRQPLRTYQAKNAQPHQVMDHEEHGRTVGAFQKLITELPALNRHLLLYILDLLAVFDSKSEQNRMNAPNLAAIFQPGIISHPKDDMAPNEYRLSQDVLIFLIENQDHFLIGMNGTAMDQKTKDEVKRGIVPTQPLNATSTIGRSASNASAGADSLRKSGGVRRNASLSSHNSRDRPSPNVSTPGTPVSPSNLATTGSSGGLGRSNTVPSNRSPAMPGTSRFQRIADSNQASVPMSAHPNSISEPNPQLQTSRGASTNPDDQIPEPSASIAAAQELRPAQDSLPMTPLDTKPATKDRKISNLLSISPMFGPSDPSRDPNQRQPRKLQKRRIPGSSIESAQSSQASLNADDPAAFHTPLATPNNLNYERANPAETHGQHMQSERAYDPSTSSPTGPREVRHVSGLMPPHSPTLSIHSRGSVTDPSDLDALEDPGRKAEKKRHRFTLSKQDSTPLAPPPPIGQHAGARTSNSSLGSNRPRKSFTGESQTTQTSGFDASSSSYPSAANVSSRESSDFYKEQNDPEKKGFLGRIKARMQQSRDERERAKSPPRLQQEHGSRHSLNAFTQEHLSPRGRSFDKSREGSLSVVDARPGHQRSGSKTPMPPTPVQWSSTVPATSVPGSAPVSAVPVQPFVAPSVIQQHPNPASAPVSALPMNSSLVPASLQSRSQPSSALSGPGEGGSTTTQNSRTVPILASEPTPESLAQNPIQQTPNMHSDSGSTIKDLSVSDGPVAAPARIAVHDQVAPLSPKHKSTPSQEQALSEARDTTAVSANMSDTTAAIPVSNVPQEQQPRQQLQQ